MRWDGFARSVAFAAAVGVAGWLLHPLAVAALGGTGAIRATGALLVPLYLAGLAPDRRRAFGVALAASAAAAVLCWLPLGIGTTAAGLAGILAVGRSGFLYRARPVRAAVLEAALCSGGLLLGAFAMGPGLASLGLGLWGFFLVQSGFFLVGGIAPRKAQPARDPFEQAHASLARLL